MDSQWELRETDEVWLPAAPSHWSIRPMKSLFDERSVKGHPNEPLLAATQSRGVVTKEEYGLRTVVAQSGLESLKLVEPGDFVISLRSFEGGIEVSHARGIISPAYTVLRLKNQQQQRFIMRLLKSRYFLDAIRMSVTGIREGQSINYSRLGTTDIPVPTEVDMLAINRYLDYAELRIAQAIQAKIALVHLLRERKSSIETELLFGGAWTTSSNSWFGLGAPGWKQLPARALFDEVIERNSVDLPMLSVTISRGVILQSDYMRSATSKKDQSRIDRSQYKAVQPGDIVYNKMRAWQGAAGVSHHRGIVSPAYVVLRPRPGVDSSYFGHVMRTAQFAREAERWSYGIASDMWSLRPQHFKTIQFSVPMSDEQVGIVTKLSVRTAEIDRAIDSAEREVALLREYRTRLIADVVTGKKDVRVEAANLPEVDPLELAQVLSGASVIEDDVEEEVSADAD